MSHESSLFLPNTWQVDVSTAKLTSMKCGGIAKYFVAPRTLDELKEALKEAAARNLPLKILGGGSNLIFADAGFTGLIIQPRFDEILTPNLDEQLQTGLAQLGTMSHAGRYQADHTQGKTLKLEGGSEVSGQLELLEMGAGLTWGQAVMQSFQRGLSGLHWYARIPCRVGGAIYNNIHGQNHLLSETVCAVRTLDPKTSTVTTYLPEELDFGYDHSRFHESGEIILSVVFALTKTSPEEVAASKQLYLDWTAKKSEVQPAGANSGSVFQNLSTEQAVAIGQTAVAAGWYVDQCGLRGETIGGMQVYPGHANFIVNTGNGTQAELLELVQKVREAVHQKFGVWLQPEIECCNKVGERMQWPTKILA